MLSGRETKYIQLCAYNYWGKMKRVRGKNVQIIPHVYIIYLMYNARGTSALSPERITGYLKDSKDEECKYMLIKKVFKCLSYTAKNVFYK